MPTWCKNLHPEAIRERSADLSPLGVSLEVSAGDRPCHSAPMQLAKGMREPWVLLGAAASLVAIFVAAHYSALYFHNVVDDSLISLTYARNLALGNGLVFNLGERVEGYTCFLWVLLLAPVHWVAALTGSDSVRLAVGLDIALLGISLVLLAAIGRSLWGRRRAGLFAMTCALAYCLVDNSFTVWAALGMETHLVACLALATVLAFVSKSHRRAEWAGVALALLCMTRPDGALLAVALLGSEFVEAFGRRRRESRRFVVVALGVCCVLYGLYFVWRYSYYGAFLPNTYYAKLGGESFDGWDRGVVHLVEYLRERGFLPVLLPLAVVFVRHRVMRALLAWIGIHVVFVTYAGGDFYPGHRFFVPLTPAMALLFGHAFYRVHVHTRSKAARKAWPLPIRRYAPALAAVAICLRTLVLGVERGPGATEVERWGSAVEQQRQGVLWLADRASAGASIYAGRIGSFGLYTDLHVYDFFGIIDPEVARTSVEGLGTGKAGHEKKATVDRILSRKPTYVIARYLPGVDLAPHGYRLDTNAPLQGGLWQRM